MKEAVLVTTPLLQSGNFLPYPAPAQTTLLEPLQAAPFTLVNRIAASIAIVCGAVAPTTSLPPPPAESMRAFVQGLPTTRAGNIEADSPLLAFVVSRPIWHDSSFDRADTRDATQRALKAIADLGVWLGKSEQEVAQLAGFARRSIPNWRAGQGAYPKTVRGLFELHALVRGLVRQMGLPNTVEWLHDQDSTGTTRWDLLGTGEGRQDLLREARTVLFAQPEREQVAAEFEEAALEQEAATPSRTQAFSEPPKRSRRVK